MKTNCTSPSTQDQKGVVESEALGASGGKEGAGKTKEGEEREENTKHARRTKRFQITIYRDEEGRRYRDKGRGRGPIPPNTNRSTRGHDKKSGRNTQTSPAKIKTWNPKIISVVEEVKTKKITREVEVPEGLDWESDVKQLIELLRKGAPLGVKRENLRRTRIYASRTRY